MFRRLHLLATLLTLLVPVLLSNCGTVTETNPNATGTEATITSGGFAFSQNSICETPTGDLLVPDAQCDGVTQAFRPFGAALPNPTPIYFNPWVSSTENRIDDLGVVDLKDIDSSHIPSTWSLTTPELLVGRTYIVQTRDGYAAFTVKALSADPASDWDVDIEFLFSTDGTTWSKVE